jgi:hypothetical protein
MAWERFTWIDDDGSLTVGTPFSAARMNSIEEGLEERASRVVVDAITKPTAGTGELKWTHAPVQTNPRGVLVFVVQDVTAADQVTKVTYGGVEMEELSGSPFLHTLGAEDGALYAYFLGKNIPGGSNQVIVTVGGAATKQAAAITLLGPKGLDLRAYKAGTSTFAATNESATTKEAGVGPFEESGVEALVLAAFHLGSNEVSEVTAATSATSILSTHDFGTTTAAWTAGSKANLASATAQLTQASANPFGAIGVVIAPVRDWGPGDGTPVTGRSW